MSDTINKFRYNDPVERMKRVNRVYFLAIILLFGVLFTYQSMLVKAGMFSDSLASKSKVIMTFAVFLMLFVLSRLSKMFNDHALGAVEEQNKMQMKIVKVIKEETNSSNEMVNSLYDASQNIAQSMQTISVSTEKIVENIT